MSETAYITAERADSKPTRFVPKPPASLAEAGVSDTLAEQLILKNLYFRGEISGRDLARQLGFSFSVIEPTVDFLKRARLVEVKRSTGFGNISSVFAVSDAGRGRAKEYLENNQFLGPAPVPLSTYWDAVRNQTVEAGWMTKEVLERAFSGAIVTDEFYSKLGPAVNSFGNSGFVVGERGFGPATALDTVDAPILKPSAFGRGWDLGACVNGGVEGRAGDAPLPPKWLITMGLRQKNRFNECKACGCEPASNHMSGFGFSATDSDSGRRAHGSHERARSARKGRKKHVSVLPRPNRSPWIVVEQNHNGIGKLMVPAFQIYANMNVINDL